MKKLTLLLCLLLVAVGCGDDDSSTDTGADTPTDGAVDYFAATEANEATQTYAEIVHDSYVASAAAAGEMNTAIEAFLNSPSAATLAAAQQAWRDARPVFLQTEVYRFYDGPIDGNDGDPEGQINAWPLDEATVDYVEGMPNSGRINDTNFVINEENLLAANGEGSEADVTVGWHAIEFLLWGQDLTEPSANLPGQRPFTDYTTANNADRRGQYLRLTGQILQRQLTDLAAAWNDAGSNYRATFEGESVRQRMEKILTGMIVLSGFETGSERLLAALDAHDQEEEHSCFSDNTHVDMIEDLVGVRNVWNGQFAPSSVNGTGVKDFIESFDMNLASTIDTQINEAITLANALQPPFDLEIAEGNTEGNARVQALIDACFAINTSLTTVFTTLGLTVPSDSML